jgi:hypothetical protein
VNHRSSRSSIAELRDFFFERPALGLLCGCLLGLFAAPAQATPSYVSELQAQAQARGLARSRMWQVLLHYHPALLGGWRSSADGPDFFLAGRAGESDPEAELAATLAAFASPAAQEVDRTEAGQHPQCRFPAR